MLAQLAVISGADRGRTISLSEGQTLVLGRGEAASARLNDPHVSRTHCQIEADGGVFRLTDSGSRGGTFINGKQIAQHELRSGEVIRVGETELRFQCDVSPGDATLPPAGLSKPKPAPKVSPLEDLVGRKIAHFVVQEKLAVGHTGMVFRAQDTEHNRAVAVKILWPETSTDESAVQRFIRAMKTMMPVRHENIVELYAAGKTGPYCWLAMEYVEGESLTQVIQRIGKSGMLEWQYAFWVTTHVARALEAAHRHEIIHRNITPANILVSTRNFIAKLGDLMLAKALSGTLARPVTLPGELVGDVLYMSPERTRGPSEVDTRSDMYSLGATVYALLTGHPPFEGGSLPEVVGKIRGAEPVNPQEYQPAIPNRFEWCVLRMLNKDPAQRHQTPAELVSELMQIAERERIVVWDARRSADSNTGLGP